MTDGPIPSGGRFSLRMISALYLIVAMLCRAEELDLVDPIPFPALRLQAAEWLLVEQSSAIESENCIFRFSCHDGVYAYSLIVRPLDSDPFQEPGELEVRFALASRSQKGDSWEIDEKGSARFPHTELKAFLEVSDRVLLRTSFRSVAHSAQMTSCELVAQNERYCGYYSDPREQSTLGEFVNAVFDLGTYAAIQERDESIDHSETHRKLVEARNSFSSRIQALLDDSRLVAPHVMRIEKPSLNSMGSRPLKPSLLPGKLMEIHNILTQS